GTASFYSDKFEGKKTVSGQAYDKSALTASHKKLPYGTKVQVTNLANGKSVVVTVNDRMAQSNKSVIELSLESRRGARLHQEREDQGQARGAEVAGSCPRRRIHHEPVRQHPSEARVQSSRRGSRSRAPGRRRAAAVGTGRARGHRAAPAGRDHGRRRRDPAGGARRRESAEAQLPAQAPGPRQQPRRPQGAGDRAGLPGRE